MPTAVFSGANDAAPPEGAVPLDAFHSNTLDEPVLDTILRDVRHIGRKLLHVMRPYESQVDALRQLRDWDLWGPLFVGLLLALLLCASSSKVRYRHDDDTDAESEADQGSVIFSIVFVVIWFGGAVVTLNAALLGGTISFWQSVCVLGYSVFPLCVARAVALLVELFTGTLLTLRLALVVAALIWCTKVSVLFFTEVIDPRRRALAVYPVFGFFFFLGWMVVVVGA